MAVLVLELLLVVALTDEEPLSTRDESSTPVSETPVPGRLGPDRVAQLPGCPLMGVCPYAPSLLPFAPIIALTSVSASALYTRSPSSPA